MLSSRFLSLTLVGIILSALTLAVTATPDIIDATNVDSMFKRESPSSVDVDADIDMSGSFVEGRRVGLSMPPVIDAENIHEVFSNVSAVHAANGGLYGLDVSVAVTKSEFACLVKSGFSFTVVRAWRSLCKADANAPTTIDAAWAGGLTSVDIYIFPAFTCALTAEQQITQALDALKGRTFGRVWLDIEAQGSSWSSDPSANVQWITSAVATLVKKVGQDRIGFYTDHNTWPSVTKNNLEFGLFPLWYPHYEKPANPSYSDFKPFGPWTNPSIKQIGDGPVTCGVSMDHNWMAKPI